MNPSEQPAKRSETLGLNLTPELREAAKALIVSHTAFEEYARMSGLNTCCLTFDTSADAQKTDELMNVLELGSPYAKEYFIDKWEKNLEEFWNPLQRRFESSLVAGTASSDAEPNPGAPSLGKDDQKVLRNALTKVKIWIRLTKALVKSVKSEAIPDSSKILNSWRRMNKILPAHFGIYKTAIAAIENSRSTHETELATLKNLRHDLWSQPVRMGFIKDRYLEWPLENFARRIVELCADVVNVNISREIVPVSQPCRHELDTYQKLFNNCGLQSIWLTNPFAGFETWYITGPDTKTEVFIKALQHFVTTATRASRHKPPAHTLEITDEGRAAGQVAQVNATAPVQKPTVSDVASQPSTVDAIAPGKLNREEFVRAETSAPGETATEPRIQGEPAILGPALSPPYKFEFSQECLVGSTGRKTQKLPQKYVKVLKAMLAKDLTLNGSLKWFVSYEQVAEAYKDGGYKSKKLTEKTKEKLKEKLKKQLEDARECEREDDRKEEPEEDYYGVICIDYTVAKC